MHRSVADCEKKYACCELPNDVEAAVSAIGEVARMVLTKRLAPKHERLAFSFRVAEWNHYRKLCICRYCTDQATWARTVHHCPLKDGRRDGVVTALGGRLWAGWTLSTLSLSSWEVPKKRTLRNDALMMPFCSAQRAWCAHMVRLDNKHNPTKCDQLAVRSSVTTASKSALPERASKSGDMRDSELSTDSSPKGTKILERHGRWRPCQAVRGCLSHPYRWTQSRRGDSGKWESHGKKRSLLVWAQVHW